MSNIFKKFLRKITTVNLTLSIAVPVTFYNISVLHYVPLYEGKFRVGELVI